MENMTNTIGKKTHTLVKKNTPRYYKIRQECGFTQKVECFCVSLCFSPAVVQILVGRLDSCFLTHIMKYMTPIHSLIFEKHVKMCVFIRQIKKSVSKKEDRLKSFIERKQRWWAHLYLNSKYQSWSLGWHEIKRIFGGRNKRNHREKHRTNKLVISKLVNTRCARE